MDSSDAHSAPFVIAKRWWVEPGMNRIVGPGGTVRLENRVMRVLTYLAHRPGETVGREELLDAIWGDRHVTEESLTSAVYRLRKALGDDPRQPGVIATIPKRGYRIIGTVEWSEEPVTAGRRGPGLAITAVVLLALAGLALELARMGRTDAGRSPQSLEPRPLTSSPGVEFDPSFAPGGERFAYVWGGEDAGDLDIWIRGVGASVPRRLIRRPGFDGSPSWRPDGMALAFMSSGGGSCAVFVVEIDNTDERQIARCHRHSESSVDWSPQGDQVAFADSEAPGRPFRIFLVPAAGAGFPEAFTDPPKGIVGDLDPVFSPDGRQVAFVRGANRSLLPSYVSPVHGDIFVAEVDSGSVRRLTFDRQEIPGLDWTLDGRRIVFSSNRGTGRYAIWEVDLVGGAPRRVLALEGILRNPTTHPNGLAFESVRGVYDLWRLDLTEPSSKPRPVLRSTRSEMSPAFSPDGEHLAFVSDRSGHPEIWVAAEDGSRSIQLTRLRLPSTQRPQWSPDSRWIVFEARREGQTGVWRIAATGGDAEWLTGAGADGTWHTFAPRYAADGERIYFASDRTGRWQIWSLELASRDLRQVTRDGGFAAMEVSPGGDLYFVRLDGPGIWRRHADSGREEAVGAVLRPADWSSWTIDGSTPIRLRRIDWTRGVIERAGREDGDSATLVALESDHNLALAGLALSPDGTTLVWSRRSRMDFDILTASGFR